MACFRRQYLGESGHPMIPMKGCANLCLFWQCNSGIKKWVAQIWLLYQTHIYLSYITYIMYILSIYLLRSSTSTSTFSTNQRAFSTTQGSDSSTAKPTRRESVLERISKTPPIEGHPIVILLVVQKSQGQPPGINKTLQIVGSTTNLDWCRSSSINSTIFIPSMGWPLYEIPSLYHCITSYPLSSHCHPIVMLFLYHSYITP